METIGAFALTEPTGGSDVAGGMRTVARRDGDGWVLDGAKRWIGNGTFADHVITWAGTPTRTRSSGSSCTRTTPA
jgi:glutaryl-CoA dehydrogenase